MIFGARRNSPHPARISLPLAARDPPPPGEGEARKRHRPYSLCGAGYAVVSCPRVLGKTEGARDAKGPRDGPAGLDTSRHRGLSNPVVAASPPSPMASRARCLRFAPQRPRWTYLSGNPPLLSDCQAAYPPLWAQVGAGKPVTGCRRPPSRGPVARGWRAGTSAASTAGPSRRISERHVIPRPPLPAPYLKMLDRHPSVTKQDARMISAPGGARISFLKLRKAVIFPANQRVAVRSTATSST